MAGYIGSKASVTQVDGYNTTEADAEFVNDPNDVITVDSGNVGIGTGSPARKLAAKSSSVTIANFESTSGTAGLVSFSDSNTTNDVTVRAGALGDNLVLQAGGTERMRIDSAGRVTMPYQPICDIQLNGNTTATGPYSTHTAHVNVGGYWNTSTHRFTAPVAGKYLVTASAYTNYTQSYGYYCFFKNGTNTQSMHFNHAGTTAHTMMGYSRIMELSANDYVQFGRPNNIGSAYFDLTFMTVQLIG